MEEIKAYSTEVVRDQQFETQVDTAKRYPRDLRAVINNSILIATMDKATAETCSYSLPRGGKQITGPSVHLARIIFNNYKNMRAETRMTHSDAKTVYSESIVYDVENNTAMKVTIAKSILDKNGKRYKEDMVVVTGNAAAAIAFRNAFFSVVPKAIVDKIHKAALSEITGDLSQKIW